MRLNTPKARQRLTHNILRRLRLGGPPRKPLPNLDELCILDGDPKRVEGSVLEPDPTGRDGKDAGACANT